jgi:hypothetical protein
MIIRLFSRLASLLALFGRGASPVDGVYWINPSQSDKGAARGTQRRETRRPAVC